MPDQTINMTDDAQVSADLNPSHPDAPLAGNSDQAAHEQDGGDKHGGYKDGGDKEDVKETGDPGAKHTPYNQPRWEPKKRYSPEYISRAEWAKMDAAKEKAKRK
ncbi:uncharacterized protein N0V89_012097 [Didymosphaeria variabile]|uniref:Uncharacterized protein n=1 Tax=Didymosphaeria variabile TaxID=1932322 RepID=A0A9W8X8I5_9PLEO|nr:uncharacterized protein N0V89_012097 [Didymosphaeria variabile]KAJ4344357.1 hypothetical protein N0V89_012097 [Didymosphaeria variabile]